MKDPVRTLLGQVERGVAALPGASLFPGLGADAAARFETLMSLAPPPGLAAFLAAHDGGVLGPDVRLLGLEEASRRRHPAGHPVVGRELPAGLWPVMDRGGRRYVLDAEEASSDGEYKVTSESKRAGSIFAASSP